MNCSDIIHRWRAWIRPLVVGIYLIVLLIALPLMVIEFQQNKVQTHIQAWFIGGVFVIMALPISFWGMLQHLVHYTNPFLQRHIIRILWMVPVYAVDAWFALRFKDSAIYLDTMRECYEAYVIYNFMAYLMSFLHAQYPNFERHISEKPQTEHFFPFCCFPKWAMGRDMIFYCRHGVLQYTVIRPITTCLALITEWAGVYKEGDFSPKYAWGYLTFINNVSQIWAMYCLVLFYRATKEELAPLKPISKFMCVKAVVFLSFWQQVLIAILVAVGWVQAKDQWVDFSTEDLATGIQDFCICVEMFLAAIAHYFSFSHTPYIDPEADPGDCCTSFVAMWDISDVRDDVFDHVRHVGSTVVRPLRSRGSRPKLDENAPLIGGASDNSSASGTFSPTSPLDEHTSLPNVASLAAHRASFGTIGSLNDSFEVFPPRPQSLTASMNNYAEFSESTNLATNLGDAKRNVAAMQQAARDQALQSELGTEYGEDSTNNPALLPSRTDAAVCENLINLDGANAEVAANVEGEDTATDQRQIPVFYDKSDLADTVRHEVEGAGVPDDSAVAPSSGAMSSRTEPPGDKTEDEHGVIEHSEPVRSSDDTSQPGDSKHGDCSC